MLFAFALGLIAVAGGAAATYFYDGRAPLAWRLCAGAPVGFSALGLSGYVAASVLGFTGISLFIAATVVIIPLVFVAAKPKLRAGVRADIKGTMRTVRDALLRPSRWQIVYALFYASVMVLLWYIFDRAMSQGAGGIFTAFDNNFGDLPFHIGIISGFVHGENFPPEHPEFAGARLTYPFIIDFIAAMFMRAGANLRGAFFFENFVLALSLVGLLHGWALRFTRDRAAALLTVALVFLSGGLGWIMFVGELFTTQRGLLDFLWHLPHNYSITPNLYRWGNSVTTLFVPQRSMLLGLPLFLIVVGVWWQVVGGENDDEPHLLSPTNGYTGAKKHRAGKGKQQKQSANASLITDDAFAARASAQLAEISPMGRMIAAGVVAGLLPLTHVHTLGVILMTGACLALLFINWRLWIAFFAAACLVAAPQLLWVTHGSATQAGNFVAPEFGWHNENTNVLWFWFLNAGLFIPALVAAIYWRAVVPVTRRALLFYLPFVLCFIVPNVMRLSPWVWDNIKVLFYWYVASAPLVALLVVNLWRKGKGVRVAACALAVALMLAGTLDVWRAISNTARVAIFDRSALQFAEVVRRQTEPQARILTAPIHNHPVLLTGRRSLFGYPGHLWTHGLPYIEREADMHRIYAGTPDAMRLLAQYDINYVVVGASERLSLPVVNEAFFARFPKVGEIGGYRLYQITRQ